MDMCHQKLGFTDELTVLLPFDGTHGDGAALVDIQTIGLSRIHLGVGGAIAVQGALADLRVDAPRDKEGDTDGVVLQLERLVEAEQGVLGGTVGRAQREAEQSR